jgi:hypothetical protein
MQSCEVTNGNTWVNNQYKQNDPSEYNEQNKRTGYRKNYNQRNEEMMKERPFDIERDSNKKNKFNNNFQQVLFI